MTNTGIHPGSGVGNNRKEISEETLGLPVIAIGIPTVVDGPVFIADAIDSMFGYIASKISEKDNPSSRLSVTPWLHSENKDADRSTLLPIFGDWASWPHEDRIQLFEEVLQITNCGHLSLRKRLIHGLPSTQTRFQSSLSAWIADLKK